MAGIPLSTTTLSVLRLTGSSASAEDIPHSEDSPQTARRTVARGVRAYIGGPSGAELLPASAGGTEQTQIYYAFSCDFTELTHLDMVRDETTGDLYQVVWATQIKALGFDFIRGQLKRDEGSTFA